MAQIDGPATLRSRFHRCSAAHGCNINRSARCGRIGQKAMSPPCSGGGIADRLGPKLVAFASAAVLVFVAFEVLITYVGLREAKARTKCARDAGNNLLSATRTRLSAFVGISAAPAIALAATREDPEGETSSDVGRS